METDSLNMLVKEVVSLAESWQNRAGELLTPEEKDIQEQMSRLLIHPMDKVILTKLIDQSFRSHDPERVADQINSLFREYGIPTFFSATDKLLVQMFLGLGRHLPEFSVPKVIEKMRHDSSHVIIPGEKELLHIHLQKRKRQDVGMNLNHLGEAVLGEAEARSRLQMYIADLKDPNIECISIKISTLYSQINPLAFGHTVDVLKDRLSLLFKIANQYYYIRNDGQKVKKFVNLDMEEYRDLEITATVFIKTLEDTAFNDYPAGIALQSYLPDAFVQQQKLTDWARKRTRRGGSPIKIRIVKGANLEMERVAAAINNWPLAPYDNKLDVDANYKRMVEFGMKPENIEAVHLGIASHNLFDLAYAYHLARTNGVENGVAIEMLEGMVDHVSRAIRESAQHMLLYAPVATKEQFINAIAYLIRRLDENTAKENFLRYASGLKTGSKEWNFLKNQFIAALHHKDKPGQTPHRVQNRVSETFSEPVGTYYSGEFSNEPNTDWILAVNREWAKRIRETWKKRPAENPMEIPLIVAGREIFQDRQTENCLDISQFPESICVARFALANDEDIQQALHTAKADPDGWRKLTHVKRHQILSNVAQELRRARGDLIGTAAVNTGKVFTESDSEVSEAIDFAEFYPYAAKTFHALENLNCHGKGVGVVISPWNFPIAIPCGGIMAALASGNTVIFKPASAAVLVGWQLCRAIWKAGVSRNVLQFLPCSGNQTGTRLTRHPDVDFIVFTGGTETGLSILQEKPGLFLAAETGGKNATIVTAMADRDQAIKNVIHSAFSNSGQKCSATSLLILEEEVYADKGFKRQLVDAAKSLAVGTVWNFENNMGPLIQPPTGDLKQALTGLEPGESWALKPENLLNNPCLWTPGIKWGVTPGSYTYLTEFFGPLLGVMRAKDLEHAIELANGTGYGLTSAIETLDKREQKRWIDGIQAGNLYINRGTTGAMVLRQPFGGMKKSVLGPGIKAGFYNYVTQFMNIEENRLPSIGAFQNDHFLLRLVQEWKSKIDREEFKRFRDDIIQTIRAVKSYRYHYEQEFSRQKDYLHLRGQDNIIRYLPAGKVVIRLHPQDSLFEVLARIAAAKISRCKPVVSIPPDLKNPVAAFLHGQDGKKFVGMSPLILQTDRDLIKIMPSAQRFRYAAPERVSEAVLTEASRRGFYISRTPVLMEGRIELLQYLTEQSICDMYHRYGNLGERALQTG
ncbi:bifunctional proline dehydrogenase/L-glutamate gamma-semialdehyde dehydrogenase [Thermodesulfobacteriota bacterium]